MGDVYVMGVDMIKFGRFPEQTVPQLGATAAMMALDDAGLKMQDMQALFCGNLGQASGMVGQRILKEIGQTGIGVVNCANACATGATAFRQGWMSIKADVHDVVLCVGVEQMGRGLLGGAGVVPELRMVERQLHVLRERERAARAGPLDDQFAERHGASSPR